MYRIESDTFILEISPEIHEQDFAYPVNVYLGVKVSSYGYSADTFMDVGVKGIAEFTLQLKDLPTMVLHGKLLKLRNITLLMAD